jgi:hypothetical protein
LPPGPLPLTGHTTQLVIMTAWARLGAVWLVLAACGACGAVQSAAAKDPMKCERDPSCARARGSFADCTRQCVDDEQCVDLCEQIQRRVDNTR